MTEMRLEEVQKKISAFILAPLRINRIWPKKTRIY